ncbi:Transposon Tf2-11 polyprotein like [Argiope bruennichi]|uniref:RNA-directed DNA polymerase n=1 Tax=Argiope bruennichi TaxID=94029 RepID=A0A8T0F398_ARGBR|nr:Transposon Tf2-11 polyprotein like [Argiope bruennichi]
MMLGNQQRDDPEAISRASCMEGKYRPGTLVWAKVFGYPYWPAVIEGDPDEGTYSKDLTTSPLKNVERNLQLNNLQYWNKGQTLGEIMEKELGQCVMMRTGTMAFLAQSKIDDLKALDLGIEVTIDMMFLNIKDIITKKGPEQEEAFETLKKRLITPPVLKQPNGSEPFRIRTGANSYALGAVLTQGEGPEEHVIEYASRLLIPAEQNYSTTERGALAVVWALEKFRGYVENQEIIIASDHQPLKWLMSIKSPSGRLARWALQIQSFNPKIEYTPGKSNVLADMLSRPTNLNEDVACGVFAISADFPVRRPRDIREEQLKDEEPKKIIDCFENSSKDEILQTGQSEERERVLQEYHDVPTAGHYGAEVTYNKVACRYYFPGMRKYIMEYVENCPDCNRYKPSNQKPTGLLRTPVYAQRFETLAIDLFGPLPETSFGKKWIFLVEDTSTKCMELFALKEAKSINYAKSLVEEGLLRYGLLPRRLISDNCSQFVSAVLQQTFDFLGIKQDLIPVYHPNLTHPNVKIEISNPTRHTSQR